MQGSERETVRAAKNVDFNNQRHERDRDRLSAENHRGAFRSERPDVYPEQNPTTVRKVRQGE